MSQRARSQIGSPCVPDASGEPDLSELGPRICIFGPSNSGKSTLAAAIGRRRGLEVVHLDRLYFVPNSDWQPQPAETFRTLHDAAIEGAAWVMEGNYSICRPQRLARATGLILMDTPALPNLLRYIRRTVFEKHRTGAVEGVAERISWQMMHHILRKQPIHQRHLRRVVLHGQLPKAHIRSMRHLNHCYARWELER